MFSERLFSYNDPNIKKIIIQKDYTHCAALSYQDKKIKDMMRTRKQETGMGSIYLK